MKQHFLVLVLPLFIFACAGNSTSEQQQKIDSLGKKDTYYSRNDTISTAEFDLFTDTSKLKVLTAVRHTIQDSTILDQHYKMCSNWFLTKEKIQFIFSKSQKISATTWDLDYAELPCYYAGQVQIDTIVADYILNAGSYIKITYGRSLQYLDCDNKAIRQYFRVRPGDDDE